MYTILISAAVALAIGAGGFFLDVWGWLGGLLLALLVFLVALLVLLRRVGKRLQPQLDAVRKNAESGRMEGAVQVLEGLLPQARWMPMLRGQLHAQLGALAHHAGDQARAVEHLSQASRRAAEGQILLACIHHRNGEEKGALEVLAAAARVNRGHSLYQSVYAYLLNKAGRVDDAIAQLNLLLRKAPQHDTTRDNVLRLQNGKKMNMKDFGAEWYALGLERPPASMGQLQVGRKGFRQPPKKRKRKPG